MYEVLQQNKEKIKNSKAITNLNKQISNKGNQIAPQKFFMVSIHREENVDNPKNLNKILTTLNKLAEEYQFPVIVSTHPRTRKRIELLINKSQFTNELIHFMKPFSFTDYINLQKNALCTISDSGTISEESAILAFPAISIRQSMERPEAQDCGSIVLTGFDPDIIINAVTAEIDNNQIKVTNIPTEYQIENTSWRVLKLILGNTKLSNKWWGINK